MKLIHDFFLRKKNMKVLRNGSKCNSITIDQQKFYVHNTCVFDSILEIVANGFINYKTYANEIKKQNYLPFSALIIKYANENINASVYFERGNILRQIFEEKNGRVDCWCNVNSLLSKLFEEIPSVEILSQCENCSIETK